MALLTTSSDTIRTTSEHFGDRVKRARQASRPDGSDRNWLRKAKAWDLRFWSVVGLQAISIAFSTWCKVESQFCLSIYGRGVVLFLLPPPPNQFIEHKGSFTSRSMTA